MKGIISLSKAIATVIISCMLIDLDIVETKIRSNLYVSSEKMLQSVLKKRKR